MPSRSGRLRVGGHCLDLSKQRRVGFGVGLASRPRWDGPALQPSVSPLFERRRPSVPPQLGLHDRDDPAQGLRNGVEQAEHVGNCRGGLTAGPACREIGW